MANMRTHFIQDNAGMALLIVLWVLVLMTVIAGEFSYTMRNQVRMAANCKESAQAYYIAVGGINQAIYSLLQSNNPESKAAGAGDAKQHSPALSGQWRTNATIGPIPFGDTGFLKVHIRNEGGKINLNQANEALLHILLSPFGLEEDRERTIVDSILDWRDENSLHRANGAEDDYYQSLPEPYECRDGDFQSKEELLLVRGITPEIYYGGLEKWVTVIPGQTQASQSSGFGGLLANFGKAGRGGAGSERLNINAVPLSLLRSLPDIEPETVEVIDSYRRDRRINAITELGQLLEGGQLDILRRYCTAEALPYYRIWAMGYTQNHIREVIEALVYIGGKGDKAYRILEWKDAVDE